MLPMTPPYVGLPPPLHPFIPRTGPPVPSGSKGSREPLGFRVFHIRYQTLVYDVPKFTKDTCKDADAVPASWAPSPCSRRKSDKRVSARGSRGALLRGPPYPLLLRASLPPSHPPAPAPGPQRGGSAPEQERRSVPCFTSGSQRNICRRDMFQLILEERKFLQLERAEIWGQGAGARSRLPAS